MYNEQEQQPKTKQELIDYYGYDIRSDFHAPMGRKPIGDRRQAYKPSAQSLSSKKNDEFEHKKNRSHLEKRNDVSSCRRLSSCLRFF